jgi:bacterioferritin (cytochrome b1)
MYIKEFIRQLQEIPINEKVVASIEEKYGCHLSVEAKKIVSFSQDGYFFDDDDLYRILALDEIINAKEELHVDFIQQELLPVIDTGDNNFIVFDFGKNRWCKFNIVDETRYREAINIADFFK